jgi:hypothetical protein
MAVSACTHTFDVHLNASSDRYKSLAQAEKKRVDDLRATNERLQKQNEIPSGIEIERSDFANHFLIRNNRNTDIFVEYEKSSMQFIDRSYRVVSGETRKIDSAQAVPDRIIAAGTNSEVSFYRADDPSRSELFTRLNISLKVDGKSYRAVKFKEADLDSREIGRVGQVQYINNTDKYLCYATGILYGGYCWFIGDAETEDFEGAKKIAAEKYRLQEGDFYLEEIKR